MFQCFVLCQNVILMYFCAQNNDNLTENDLCKGTFERRRVGEEYLNIMVFYVVVVNYSTTFDTIFALRE